MMYFLLYLAVGAIVGHYILTIDDAYENYYDGAGAFMVAMALIWPLFLIIVSVLAISEFFKEGNNND